MVEDILTPSQAYDHMISLVSMLQHFLSMYECHDYLKVAYDFNHKQLVFLNEGEQRPYDIVGTEGDYQSEDSSDEESFSDIDEPSDDEHFNKDEYEDHTKGDFF